MNFAFADMFIDFAYSVLRCDIALFCLFSFGRILLTLSGSCAILVMLTTLLTRTSFVGTDRIFCM